MLFSLLSVQFCLACHVKNTTIADATVGKKKCFTIR